MKRSLATKPVLTLFAFFLFFLTSWTASAQMQQNCSCELDYNPIVSFQSPFDDCCYAFVFGTVTVVPGENGWPGLNECLVSQSDNVNWHISGPGINMGTSTGPNEALVQCFTDGVYTICARRQVVVINPTTGLEEECTISDCTTVVVEGCGDEECVCIPEDLGINIGNINVNGCSVYVSGSSEPVDGCWELKELVYSWGDTEITSVEDTWISARHTYDCNGWYQVTVTGIYVNADGETCESSDTQWVQITDCEDCLQGPPPSGLNSNNPSNEDILISPNPVQDALVLSHSFSADQQATIRIMNAAGQVMMEHQETLGHPTFTYQVESLPKGMYYIVFTSEEGNHVTKPFIKQ